MSLVAHPIAEVFPLMCGASFDDLVGSIANNGLRNPIVLYEGKILDGRNRYLACEKAGVEARFVNFDGGDPIAFVVDENLHRRQLNESQKALAAAELETLKKGQRLDYAKEGSDVSRDTSELSVMSRSQISKAMDVGKATIHRAKVVLEKAAPEDIAAIKEGKKTVNGIYNKVTDKPKRVLKHKCSGTREQNNQIWSHLKGAIIALTGLPRPTDVVPIAKSYRTRNHAVDSNLRNALTWLEEFVHAYENN